MRYGIIIGIIVGLVGCGEVEPIGDGGPGTAGTTGSSGTTGTGGVTGTGGTSGRPLGAGCVDNGQCGSNICDAISSTCCDGLPDACNTCVSGYKTPTKNGTVCGTGVCQGNSFMGVPINQRCQAGECVQGADNNGIACLGGSAACCFTQGTANGGLYYAACLDSNLPGISCGTPPKN